MPDLSELSPIYVYLGTFVLLVAAGLGMPIPEELPIVMGGAWVGHAAEHPEEGRRLYWWIMLPLCISGVVISDSLLYGMGRFWGPRILEKKWMQRILPAAKRQRIEKNFHDYGVMVLLFARFLPAIRSPIFIMAGVMRLSFVRFVVADGIYAIPGVTLLFTLAFWFGDQFTELVKRLEEKVGEWKPIVILVALSVVAVYLIYHFYRHPVATGDPREELPILGDTLADQMETDEPQSESKPQEIDVAEKSEPIKQEGTEEKD